MPSRQDCQRAVVGTQINDGTLAHYQAYGATSNDFNTAEYEFLIANGATPGHNHDMWRELLVPLLGYSAALPDMLQDFWCNYGGVFTPPAPPLFDGTIPNLNSLNFVVNANVYDASGNFDTGGFVNQYSLINAPAFMSINNRGVIKVTLDETAAAAATYSNIQVQGNNITGPAATSNTFSLTIDPNIPVFDNGPIPPIVVEENTPISPPISTSQYFTTGGPVETYSLQNAPAWLSIDANTGVLSGTPILGQDSTITTVTATNVDGSAASNQFSITVTDVVTPPVYTGVPIPDITGNISVAITPYDVAAGGHFTGDPVTVYELLGAPSWMQINASTGLITGTPDASGTTNNIRVRANNNAGSALSNFFSSIISAQILPLFARDYSQGDLGPDATFARASNGAVTDFEDVIRIALDNESRFERLRRVENLITGSSDDLTNGWTPGGNTTLTYNPTEGATRVQMPTGAGTYVYQHVAKSTAVIGSLEVKLGDSGTSGNLLFDITDGVTAVTTGVSIAPTNQWQRVATGSVDASSYGNATFNIDGDGEVDFYIRHCQAQDKTGASDPTVPDDYVSVGVGQGPEEITNGSFDTDTSGWAANGAILNQGTFGGRPNVLEVADDGAWSAAYQEFATTPGRLYLINLLRFRPTGTTTGNAQVYIQNQSSSVNSGDTLVSFVNITDNEWVSDTVYFRAEETVTRIKLHSDSIHSAYFDDVSIKLADHGANVDGVQYFPTTNGNSVDGNGVVTEAPGTPLVDGRLLMEPSATNYLLNSDAPATQTTGSLSTGTYTLWMDGTGDATVSAGTATISSGGTATDGSPFTFDITGAGTVTVTVTGTPTRFQLENSGVPTSFILTAGSIQARAADTLSYPLVTPQTEGMAIAVVDSSAVTADMNMGFLTAQSASRQGWLYKNAGTEHLRAFDGTTQAVAFSAFNGIRLPTVLVTRWSAGQMHVGYKWLNGTWSWVLAAYDGDWPNDAILRLCAEVAAPFTFTSVEIFQNDLGEPYVEGNY